MLVRRPAELDALDGIVLPGGESTTIDKLMRAFGLFEPLADRIAAGLPVFGSCAGMILLADRLVEAHRGQRTLGGIDMLVRRNAFGRQVDSFEADLEVADARFTSPVHAVFIRAPWVEEIGAGVEVLASVDFGGGSRPVAVRQGRALATSFHPEVTGDLRFHEMFARMTR
ncbi:pyridoxal 5'-phosphate synthase subunit PdxT [Mobilicoccus caccae]|uniref:glutaminase n=1 Tax=Mobilicoccus caccae TaxID=1859295 RepID=A0ABQ6IQP3_9MICO|nr:pyridoxal 5'-phosphate synthase subunit PdxT [Mobilicoccus caccae]